jgi:acetyl-CoA carboxylase biotin carboxyl carrier protein
MSITDINYVKEAAGILKDYKLTKLEINFGEMKILMEQAGEIAAVPNTAAVNGNEGETPAAPAPTANKPSHTAEVKAPLVGVFYSAPNPDAEPYVRIGDEVRKGDVLCIIEAMKLMNEITAEHDGKIADICVKNGDIAEYGQVLFVIRLDSEK